ncbi:MAG: NADH-quinone oxidoreductase subunit B, partial [Mesorhizobium sp.]
MEERSAGMGLSDNSGTLVAPKPKGILDPST